MGEIVIGATIGGYQILEEIGEGGMATVYRAHQLSMNRDVAIKVLPQHISRQPHSLDRFQQEAKIVARLEHRAIVPVHDYGEYEGTPYLVMRYMDGGSVDDLLAGGPINPARTLEILRQIAPALDYAHQNDVLHRDLKPSNILLDANGDAYITDFGIARLLGEGSTSLTTTGVVGTPSYMSPEQAQGHDLDGRSDVYALGVVLFEMLTGARPFEGETPYSVAVKHVTEAPPPACTINPQLPRTIEPVLFKVLEKQRDRRYQTAGEFADALNIALERSTAALALPASMVDTDPSLEQALRDGADRRAVEPSQAILPNPVLVSSQRNDFPPVRSYAAPASSSQFPSLRQPRARRVRPRLVAGQPPWVVWTLTVLIVSSLVLVFAIGAVYYLFNDSAPGSTDGTNYPATAVFRLTATKRAILDDLATVTLEPFESSMPSATIVATVPPTNTRPATVVTSTPPVLPLIVTEDPAQ